MADLAGWILDIARIDEDEATFVAGLAAALRAAGIEVTRVGTSFRTLHPEVWVRNVTWTVDGGAVVHDRPHEHVTTPDYVGSTVAAIHAGGGPIRQRLDVAPEAIPYPQLGALAQGGATDYVIRPIPLPGGARTFISYVTARPGGFVACDLAAFEAIDGALAARVQLLSMRRTTGALLTTYLGRNAAARVLAGGFRRGSGEEIAAAIWYCDLRGFTAFSDARPPHEVVGMLDEYFEAVAGPVEEAGGEVLKFIGDAMLAIFPVEEGDARPACKAALAAAEAALDRFAVHLGPRGLGLGIALHLGDVMYGNIGARDRLDFTVIGHAVNELCRVEALCKELRVPLLMTAAFATATGRADIRSLGARALKGVRQPQEVATLARFSP